MNLVVDDAVEVRLATKSEEEKRRNLGTLPPRNAIAASAVANAAIEQVKSFSKAITYHSFKPCNDNILQYYANQWANGRVDSLCSAFQVLFVFLRLRTSKILHFGGGMKKENARRCYFPGYERFADSNLPSPTMITSTGWSWLATGISSGGLLFVP